MRPLRLLLLVWIGVWQCSVGLLGAEYHLNNGDVVRGEPVSFNDDGMVVRLDIGGYSPQISWSKLTQESLQELARNPKAANFVEPFIDTPPVQKEKEKKKKEIVLKPVPRVEHIDKPSFFSAFATPGGLGVFLVLFLANIYAAYEVARFRNRPPALVCGLSAIFPVLAPGMFLAMPTAAASEGALDGTVEPAAAAQAAGKATTGPLAKVPMASGLSIHQEEKAAAASGGEGPQTYKRGEFTFNRRFFETKFPGFFRVIPADPNLILAVRLAKAEHIAKRITRISSNEVHLQPVRGGNEVSVPFNEITEIQVRRMEVKA
jgi:hypothetical protein